MNDRTTVIQYHTFFKEKYGKKIFSKSRKREDVFVRKLIVLFLVKDKGFKETFVSKIMQMNHSVVFYYLKPVIDLEFDRYYIPRVRELKEEFDKKFSENET